MAIGKLQYHRFLMLSLSRNKSNKNSYCVLRFYCSTMTVLLFSHRGSISFYWQLLCNYFDVSSPLKDLFECFIMKMYFFTGLWRDTCDFKLLFSKCVFVSPDYQCSKRTICFTDTLVSFFKQPKKKCLCEQKESVVLLLHK